MDLGPGLLPGPLARSVELSDRRVVAIMRGQHDDGIGDDRLIGGDDDRIEVEFRDFGMVGGQLGGEADRVDQRRLVESAVGQRAL